MRFKFLNKKGADKLLSAYWFMILTLIAGGVFAMAYNFYSVPYDVRDVEANIMADKVADCISYKGFLNPNLFSDGVNFSQDFRNNFLKNCHLDFGSGDELEYYVRVNFFRVDDVKNSVYNISVGNLGLFQSCEIKEEDYERLAHCVEKRFYSLGENKTQYLININSVVRKVKENVK